jgi:hypothetical protein
MIKFGTCSQLRSELLTPEVVFLCEQGRNGSSAMLEIEKGLSHRRCQVS